MKSILTSSNQSRNEEQRMAQEKPVILLSRQLPEMFTAALGQVGEVRVSTEQPDDALLEGATVYLATGVDSVPADLIQRFPPELGLIANIATGIDNIDLEAAAARGIAVSNTPVVTEDTADLTMALMLATCRRLSFCERALRMGQWELGAGQLGTRVHGKTLGIVGMGAIGQAVAKRAAAFDMNILYHGPNPKPNAETDLCVQYRKTLPELLAESDIVSLNCPLNVASRHLLDAQALGQMKPGAILINTGRGPLVDEKALVEALASGHLGGAGLDVFEFEPEVTPRLLDFDNVTLLPHIGSATGECRTDMAMRAFANIRQFLAEGSPIDNCV
jgi:glyoxylate reductase